MLRVRSAISVMMATCLLACSATTAGGDEVPADAADTAADVPAEPEDIPATPEELPPAPEDIPATPDPGPPEVFECGPGTPTGKATGCAANDELGSSIEPGFGRGDGTVTAVVPPTEMHCEASCNPTHLTVEVAIAGKPHRFVVTMRDKYSDDHEMFYLAKAGLPLAGPAWSEGWHNSKDDGGDAFALDYVTTLGVHAGDFASHPRDELAALVSDQLAIGAKVSVFATSGGDDYRAHLVHRYAKKGDGRDGAIVVDPDGAPTHLLFFYEGEKNF